MNQEETTVTNDDNLEEPPDGLFDDDDEDNENVISLEKIKASTLGLLSPTKANGDRSSIDGDSESRASFAEKRVVPLTDIQDPFQPSSTPAHFQHRYMVKKFFLASSHFKILFIIFIFSVMECYWDCTLF